MKTILFCTSYIGDEATWQNRYKPWLNYYSDKQLGADKIIMIDDGSPFKPPENEIQCIDASAGLAESNAAAAILRFNQRLGRSSLLSYPGWWRSFLHAAHIARELKADKIIHIESDAFILSPRLLEHIENIQSGWTSLWSPHYRIAETAVQVICADQFHQMDQLKLKRQSELDGKLAENILPFTHIEKSFRGDRYGDIRNHRGVFRSKKFHHWPLFDLDFFWAKVPPDADFATQVTERLWRNSPVLHSIAMAPFSAAAT